MDIKMRYIVIVLLYAFSTISFAGPIGLEGDEIDAAMIRTIDDPFYGSGRICCYGLDAPFVVENGLGDQQQYSSSFLLNVESFSFNIEYISQFGSWQEGLVLRLSDLDFGGAQILEGLSIDTNVDGLTWFAGENFVDIHLGGTEQGGFINGSFLVASVPEPSSLLLLTLSLGFLLLRRRNTIN